MPGVKETSTAAANSRLAGFDYPASALRCLFQNTLCHMGTALTGSMPPTPNSAGHGTFWGDKTPRRRLQHQS